MIRHSEMAYLIRAGRKLVARQVKGAYFQWDARRPRWRLDKYPPNCACATGMALLAEGYRGPWDVRTAETAAILQFGADLVREVGLMNDHDGMRWDRIAAALEAREPAFPSMTGGVQSEKESK